MRTQGSLRVILNTKIWAGMTIERASQKSLRITATDGDEGIKVFLINVSYFFIILYNVMKTINTFLLMILCLKVMAHGTLANKCYLC